MADPTKGIQAGLTFLAAILITYFTWDMAQSFLNSTSDEPLHTMLWIAYAVATLSLATLIPFLIVTNDDEDGTSIVDGIKMYGVAWVSMGTVRLFYPFAEGLSAWIPTEYGEQVFGFLILFACVIALYIFPLIVGIWPSVFEGATDAALNAVTGGGK